MNEIQRVDLISDDSSEEENQQQFDLGSENALSGLLTMALCYRRARERGWSTEKMEAKIRGMNLYLRRVASGKLHPKAVLEFAGKPEVLDKLMRLPLDEQLRFVEGLPVAVYDSTGDHCLRDLKFLSKRELDQVFSEDGLSSPQQQKAFVQRCLERDRKRSRPPQWDAETLAFIIAGKSVRLLDLCEAVNRGTKEDQKAFVAFLRRCGIR